MYTDLVSKAKESGVGCESVAQGAKNPDLQSLEQVGRMTWVTRNSGTFLDMTRKASIKRL